MINKEMMDNVKYAIGAMWRNEEPESPIILQSTDVWLLRYGVGAGASDCVYRLKEFETLTNENRKEIIDELEALYSKGKEEVCIEAEGSSVCQAPSHAYIAGYNLAVRNALTLLRIFDRPENPSDNYMLDWFGIDHSNMER